MLAASTFFGSSLLWLSDVVKIFDSASFNCLEVLPLMQVWPSTNPWACVATESYLPRSECTEESNSPCGILDFFELCIVFGFMGPFTDPYLCAPGYQRSQIFQRSMRLRRPRDQFSHAWVPRGDGHGIYKERSPCRLTLGSTWSHRGSAFACGLH